MFSVKIDITHRAYGDSQSEAVNELLPNLLSICQDMLVGCKQGVVIDSWGEESGSWALAVDDLQQAGQAGEAVLDQLDVKRVERRHQAPGPPPRLSHNHYVAKLEKLWDVVSDCIEGERLKEGDLPDDYRAIVAAITEAQNARAQLTNNVITPDFNPDQGDSDDH